MAAKETRSDVPGLAHPTVVPTNAAIHERSQADAPDASEDED